MKRLTPPLFAGFLAFTAVGGLFAAQFYLHYTWLGQRVTWGQTLSWTLGSWYAWALLSPAILWLVRRVPLDRAGWLMALAGRLGFGMAAAAVHVLIFATWTWLVAPMGIGPPGWSGAVQSVFVTSYTWDLFCYAAIAAVFDAIENAVRYRQTQTRAARLEAQLARAQVEALRMQLHPHFLFNTLNAITALIREDPRGAEEMVARLGELLRATLDKSGDPWHPLRQELEFVEKYLEIQRVRFGERLMASIEVAPEAREALVPTFVLQPLIENAVRHGLSSEAPRCEIRVRARVAEGALLLEVQDSGPGLSAAGAREGIGLYNTRARLRQLYGAGAQCALRNGSPSGCVVSLRMPARRGDEPTDEVHAR